MSENTKFDVLPPESLVTYLTEALINPETNEEVKKSISLSLLRMGKWVDNTQCMENSLRLLINDSETTIPEIREIIFRLSKIDKQINSNLLTMIANSATLPEECKYLACAAFVIAERLLDKTLIKSEDILQIFTLPKDKVKKIISTVLLIEEDELGKVTPSHILEGFLTDIEIKTKGHLIHKLKAKDATGRWAYYFVLVESEKEDSFLKRIGGDGTIDLEKYGKVIASCYGETATDEVKQFLNEKYGFKV